MAVEETARSMEYTSTWVVTVVCFVIVVLSLLAERGLHRLGKLFKHKKQDALYEALEKVKAELMLLGFISLLLTVTQGLISNLCIPPQAANIMLPCKFHTDHNPPSGGEHLSANHGMRRLLTEEDSSSLQKCESKGMVPLLSLEALHQLHIFIFVLAVVHVIFCVTTMLLGTFKISQWKNWETSVRSERTLRPLEAHHSIHIHNLLFTERAGNYWRKFKVVSWTVAFFKQFYGSVTKSDYIALRKGFVAAHCPSLPDFDFHKYMLRTLEHDFKKIVGISWYLWMFVMVFLLVNLAGWHSYFWLSFLPLVLLLLVGAKLEHIITELAKDVQERSSVGGGGVAAARGGGRVEATPSDELFWFHRPTLVLYLIHFILFQNSFEIGFLAWVWATYGFRSCIMEDLGFIIPRIIVGVIVQVLCSYSTLPLYALVTQMGSQFKQGMFDAYTHGLILDWAKPRRASSTNSLSKDLPFDAISVTQLPSDQQQAVELTH